MRSTPLFALAVACTALLACGGSAVPPTATPTSTAAPAQARSGEIFAASGHAGCGEEKGAGCGEAMAQGAPDACAGASQPIAYPDATTATDATGKAVTVAGARLGGVALVAVADLLAHPDSYAGKTVRLEGNVAGMCQHRRAWFAVQGEGRQGSAVQVIAAPAFLVPQNAVGMHTRTEGKVELVTRGGDAKDKVVVVHATGAEFL
jgi:hypothetical protein